MADVTVRFFAAAAEAAGCDEQQLTASTVGELRAELESRYGEAMARVLRTGSFLVGGIVSRDPGTPVTRQVDVLPAFSGG